MQKSAAIAALKTSAMRNGPSGESTEKCDGNCDGSSDFAAKTDFIDKRRANKINNLRICNTL
jgi:hypothetical protein